MGNSNNKNIQTQTEPPIKDLIIDDHISERDIYDAYECILKKLEKQDLNDVDDDGVHNDGLIYCRDILMKILYGVLDERQRGVLLAGR